MTGLFLIGLTVWVLIIQIRLADAEHQLRALRRARPGESPGPLVRDPHPADAPVAAEVLAPEPARARAEAAAADPGTAVAPHAPRPARPPSPEVSPSPPPAPAGPGVAAWLSENGLAWLGGGALALGGALLAAYAAQQGLFTPALRIWTALALGLAMLAAGEVIRRLRRAPGGRHGLAAAMASGAGASTLYVRMGSDTWKIRNLLGYAKAVSAAHHTHRDDESTREAAGTSRSQAFNRLTLLISSVSGVTSLQPSRSRQIWGQAERDLS
jgi:uncharacterized membrane protein